MNAKPALQEDQPSSSKPSLKQQAIMTIKVLLFTGATLAALWVLDLLVAP